MQAATLFLIFLTYSLSSIAQDPCANVYSESAWKDRDQWQKADAIIDQLKIKTGSKAADIGCHEGYMTMKLARIVGSTGQVHAVDVDASRLKKLKDHLATSGITQVITIQGDRDDPHLPEGMLDAVLILDTYHEMKEHDAILQHIRTALKPMGRLVICEPIAKERREKSRSEQETRHELGLSFAKEDLIKAGFKIILTHDPFVDREKIKGDSMWILVAEK